MPGRLCLLAGGLLLCVLTASAQPVRVSATVDRSSINADDVVQYEVEVTGAALASVASPSLPPLDGLTAETPFPVTIGEEVTGQAPRVVFRWSLRPTRSGQVRIGSTSLRIGGAMGRTAPLVVNVRPGNGAPPPPPDPARTPFGDRPVARPLGPGDVVLRATASSARAVVGEQVVVEYRLYARPDLDLRFSPAGSWNASGAWREDLVLPRRPLPEPLMLGVRRYSSVVVQRVALFPTQPGRLTLPALTIEGEADVPVAAALYGPDAPRTPHPFRVTSAPLTLVVEAPPRSPDFSGLVGRVRLTAALDTPQAVTGQSLQLRVRVSGDANLAALEPPRLALPDAAFEVFGPEPEFQAVRTGPRLTATRTFTYGIVPRRAGTFHLPPVTLVVFDPAEGRLRTLRAEPGTLTVSAAPDAPVGASSDDARETTAQPPRPLQPMVIGALLLFGLWGAAWAFLRRRRTPETAPPIRPAPPTTSRPYAALLDEAEQALDAQAPRHAAACLARALDLAPGMDAERRASAPLRTRLNEALYAPALPDEALLRDTLEALRLHDGARQTSRPGRDAQPF